MPAGLGRRLNAAEAAEDAFELSTGTPGMMSKYSSRTCRAG
jgi:hypothetical protein